MNAARTLDSLSPAELEAISTLWKRERRELVMSFSGVSMLPAIAPGQQVVVQCGVEPAVGDVAVFRFDNRVGVHRVVARSASWLLTWGDANLLPDEPIRPMDVMGAIRQDARSWRSASRGLLIRLVAGPGTSLDRVTQRVRFAHRIRAAWAQGLLAFSLKALRALIRLR